MSPTYVWIDSADAADNHRLVSEECDVAVVFSCGREMAHALTADGSVGDIPWSSLEDV